jgi:integrase
MQRRYFRTRDAATEEATRIRSEYRAHGEGASVLPPRVADEALAALKLLDGTGGGLLDAARAFKAAWDARTASRVMGEAVAEYLASREDLRDATLNSYRYTLERTLSPLHDRMLSDISPFALEAILGSKGGTAKAMHRRNLGAFWRWACRSPREWAQLATLQALEPVRASKDGEIWVLNSPEVRALLKAAEMFSPAAAVAFAVATFGGIRMRELHRLTWADVLEDHIEIGRSAAKKHSRRLVPICTTLRAWLDYYRGEASVDDPLTGYNWREVSCAVRRLAGWEVKARLLDDPPQATRGRWAANACRHTCASVQVAIGTPLDDLIFKFGHTGGHGLLRAHYVARMTKKEALAVLAIGPGSSVISLMGAA